MKTPINAKTLKTHFTYSWWKYLLIALLAFGLVDLLYSVTAYRSPPEKKVEFFVYGVMNEDELRAYMDRIHETEMQDMEVLNPVMLLDDDSYGPMQLTTYLAVGEGDVYLLPREQYLSCAASGSLVALEGDTELMELMNSAGVNLQNGWRRETETGETHLFGIPQDKLPGLRQYAWAKDGYLCVIVTGGNTPNAMKFLRILCRDTLSAPAEAEPSPVP